MTQEQREEQLRQVRDEVITCTKCELCKGRKNPVIGMGSHEPRVVLVGEAPGEMEDLTAKPFVGPAGAVLDERLNAIGMKREEVYICNTLKCRPPGNAKPTVAQKEACESFLTRQIEALQPEIIVCLGNHAASSILNLFGRGDVKGSIGSIHGQVFEPDDLFKQHSMSVGEVSMAAVKILPMYHPAAVLHNPPLARMLQEDFNKLKELTAQEPKQTPTS